MERDFTIHCLMNERWIASFVAVLKMMEHNGSIGHSEYVGLYSDGDGDFRPKFKYDPVLEVTGDKPMEIHEPSGQITVYDAG